MSKWLPSPLLQYCVDYLDYKPGTQIGESADLRDFDVEEFLERSQENESERLEDELERVEQQLEKRERIHEETISELKSKLDWYVERLKTLYKQHRGKHGKRDEIKSRIKEFYREIRTEKREQWRDRQELEMERRELLRELEELSDDSLENLL